MGHVILSWNMEVKQKRFWAETIFKLRQGASSTRFVGRSVGNEFYISVMLLVVYICC